MKKISSIKRLIVSLILLSMTLYGASPIVTSSAITNATEDSPYSYSMSATDNDNDVLSWSAKDGMTLPSWITLSSGGLSTTDFVTPLSAAPKGVGYDESTGFTYLATDDTNKTIWKIDSNGNKTPFAHLASNEQNYGNMIIKDGFLYVSLYQGDKVIKFNLSDASENAPATNVITGISMPIGMALKDGFLYVSAYGAGKIIKVDLSNNTQSDYWTNTGMIFGIVFDTIGNLYGTVYGSQKVIKRTGLATSSDFITNTGAYPTDMKIDNNSNWYVSTSGGGIKKYSATFDNNTTIASGLYSWGMTFTNSGTLIFGSIRDYKLLKLETGATLIGTPTNDDVGVHDINLSVSDGTNTTPHSFQITVTNTNDTPSITSIAITTVTKNTPYSYTPTATDVDIGDILTWAVKNGTTLPIGLDFNGTVLSGTLATKGFYDVNLTVTDGITIVPHNFLISAICEGGNCIPEITTTPITQATQNSSYSYTVKATDEDGYDVEGNIISWAVNSETTLPSWLTFSSTGATSTTDFATGFTGAPKGVGYDELTGFTYLATDDTNRTIWKIDSNGNKTQFAQLGSNYRNYGNMIVKDGFLYVSLYGGDKIVKLNLSDTSGSASATDVVTDIIQPIGMAFKDGYLYVALYGGQKVIQVNLTNNTQSNYWTNTGAIFGIVFDANDELYATVYNDNKVIKKTGASTSSDFIINIDAYASDIKIDNNGNWYVSTSGGGIKKYSPSLETSTTIASGLSSWGMTFTNSGTLIFGDTGSKLLKLETGATLSGTPTNSDVGVHDVNLTVSDGENNVTHNFQITVANVNDAPTSANGTFTINEDTNKTFSLNDFNRTDIDVGDSIEAIIITSLPTKGSLKLSDANVTVNQIIPTANIGNLVYIPVADEFGAPYTSFGFRVFDGELNSTVNYTSTINVTNIDDAPTLSAISNVTKQEDATDFNVTLVGADIEGNAITYTVTSSDTSKVTVSIVNGKVVVTPIGNKYGIVTIEVNATSNGKSAIQSFEVDINATNDTPVIDTIFSDISVLEDSGVTNFELGVSDVDGDELNVTLTSSNENLVRVTPNWNGLVNIASYQGLDFNISTVPNANGVATITLTVEDADGETNTQSFDINVTAVNDAPTLSLISDVIVYKNSGDKNITVVASDIENTSLTYSATVITSNKIEYATFTNNILSIKPLSNISGDTNITVTATDGVLSASRTFNFYIVPIEDGVDAERVGIINKSTDINGTTTTLSIDSNLTVNAQTKTNGDTTHRIEVAGKTIEATSSINGSVVEIVDGGVHTTYNENNLAIEAEATLLGEATHKLTTNGKTAEATSQIVGATTVISEVSGMKQITTSIDMNNTTISAKAKADGTAEHTVTLQSGTISKTTSDIGGAKTTITNSGDVKTEAGDVLSGGYTVKALAITQTDGKTITRFIKVNNSDENDVQILGNTVTTTTPFEAGNNVEIKDIGGMLYIKTSAPLDENLVIE